MNTFILIIFCSTFLIIPIVYSQKGSPGPKIVDIDGNSYKTVYIGGQQWMAENLNTSRFNDGTPIKNIPNHPYEESQRWGYKIPQPAWCYYDDDKSKYGKYGKLYNWYAVSPTNNKNICPRGWHVPSDDEFGELLLYLEEGDGLLGGYLKSTGTLDWRFPNVSATNSSLFNALPGGYRHQEYSYVGYHGSWWTSTESDELSYDKDKKPFAVGYFLYSHSSIVDKGQALNSSSYDSSIYKNDDGFYVFKTTGMSIRCIKDY